MKIFIIICFSAFTFVPLSVLAEENSAVCMIVAKHTPQSDVAYQAGVDVYGNAVVPADLNAAPVQLPNVIKVPLSVDFAERLGGMVEDLQLEAPLGMLEISQDGSVRYNGQDWTAPVMTLCGQSHKEVLETMIIEAPAQMPQIPTSEHEDDGQPREDVIKSSSAVEIKPTQALPPTEVRTEQMEIEPAEDESDIIEGGDYREMYYNE